MGCAFSSNRPEYTDIQKKCINALSSFSSKEKVEPIRIINNRIEVYINGIKVTIGFTDSDSDVGVFFVSSGIPCIFNLVIVNEKKFVSDERLALILRYIVR